MTNATDRLAVFHVARGDGLAGRLGLPGGGRAFIPTSGNSYAVEAAVTLQDGNTYIAAPRILGGDAGTVLARMR